MHSGLRDLAVSAIITTYNRRDLVQIAIASVLQQSFTDFELLVVDDGSTDDTAAVVGQIRDPRIRYIYQENAGLAAARNAGIRLARGEYIAFLDDDDCWLPTKLQIQVTAMRDNPQVGLTSGGWIYVDDQGAFLSENRPWQWRPRLDLDTWLVACPVITCAVLVRREWLDRLHGFDESISRARLGAEDWDAWLRLAHAGCPMMWVRSAVCAYRMQEGTMSRDARRQRQGMLRVLEKFFAVPDLPGALLARKNSALAQAHLRGAAREYGGGWVEEARQDVALALELEPGLLANRAEGLYCALTAWIGEPTTGDPLRYVPLVFDNLPPQAAILKGRRRSALAVAAKQSLFHAYTRGDRAGVLRDAARLAAWEPRTLLDRGVVSAAAEAVVGARAASLLRRVAHGKPAAEGR